MDDKTTQYLRQIQFEKCKGELRALAMMFDFYPTYDGVGYDSVSKERAEIRKSVKHLTEDFIDQMKDFI